MRHDRIMQRADVLARYTRPFGGPLPTEAEVEEKILSELTVRGVAVQHQPGSQVAFVNDSRWVIECDCGAGIACSPSLDTALCPDCGARYDVEWPDEQTQRRIEKTLLERPAKLPKRVDPGRIIAVRSWTPDQDVEALEAETETLKAMLTAKEG